MELEQIRINEQAKRNIDNLQNLRLERKLTLQQLSMNTGVPYRSLSAYECGQNYPSVANYNKLARFFGWNVLDKELEERFRDSPIGKWKTRKEIYDEETKLHLAREAERRRKLTFKFDVSRVYEIDKEKFKYVCEKGIHHQFRALKAKWTMTLAYYQLIGRKIAEVQQ